MHVTTALTSLAMIAFAANSLLARAALGDGAIDAPSYTLLRLAAGAAALAAIVAWRRGADAPQGGAGLLRVLAVSGTWTGGAALLAYAAAFSFAYLVLGAATGALVLFASVQGTMVLLAFARGDRPTPGEAAGLAVAFAAFAWLVAPGLHAPDPRGAALMVASGAAWAVYTVHGRGRADPLPATAGNFLRAALLAVPLWGIATAAEPAAASAAGMILAAVSGAVTSGVGYAVWYAVLPRLSTTGAAVVQLTVPAIAAAAAVVLLGEPATLRLLVASAAILGGVAAAILSRRRPPAAAT